jgi:small membrane protein
MLIFQILVIIFAVFALTRVFLQKRQKNFSLNEFLFWSVLWAGVIVLSFSRDILQRVALFVGIANGGNLLMYSSITLIFYMVYRLYAKVDSQQQEITSLVSKIAINNAKKKKK